MPNGNMMPPNALQRNPLGKTNALAATQGQPAPKGNSSGQFSVSDHVQNNWDQAEAQHKQLLESAKRLDNVRMELDSLGKLGDSVTVEDVIKGAGTLVGTGFSPMAIAQLLSSMPTTGGEALQAWIRQQDEQVQGMEAQMRQKVMASSIHRGITGMAALHVQHIKDSQGGSGNPSGAPIQLPPSMAPPEPAPGGEEDNEE